MAPFRSLTVVALTATSVESPISESRPSGSGFAVGSTHTLPAISVTFWPPKPNEFDSTVEHFFSRGLFGM